MHAILYKGTTSLLRLSGLQNESGAYVNGATVTLESLTERQTGDAVTGLSVPLSMPYAGGDGVYEASLAATLNVDENGIYIAEIKAVIGGIEAIWKETIRVKYARA